MRDDFLRYNLRHGAAGVIGLVGGFAAPAGWWAIRGYPTSVRLVQHQPSFAEVMPVTGLRRYILFAVKTISKLRLNKNDKMCNIFLS